ncbi:MAG: hypothetical protein EOP54_09340 [Sphingobacteriales bacterium]|nr:MAG: hypothetical protein EOP54_09340 [Sphingobacteriales bacterium]
MLQEGVDFYFNEEGLMVITAAYHLKRGRCCGNGCLHCPYSFENVKEPRKTQLLEARKRNNEHE